MKNTLKLVGIMFLGIIVLNCTPKKTEVENVAETQDTELHKSWNALTPTENGHGFIYGIWQYVEFDENGAIFVPVDEGPGDPELNINADNSMAFGAYETNIQGSLNIIDENNYHFMVNNRSRMWTQETVDEIIYLQYDSDTKLLKYDDPKWEEIYYFIKEMEGVPTKARPQTQPSPLEEFQMVGTTLVHYNGNEAHVTIPSSVTEIANYAFMYNRLTSVDIPSSVISIDNNAFADSGLKTVTMSRSTMLGDRAFELNVEIIYRD